MKTAISGPFPEIMKCPVTVILKVVNEDIDIDSISAWLFNRRSTFHDYEICRRNFRNVPVEVVVGFTNSASAESFIELAERSRSENLFVSKAVVPRIFDIPEPVTLCHRYNGGHESFAEVAIRFSRADMQDTMMFELDTNVFVEVTATTEPRIDWEGETAAELGKTAWRFLIAAYGRLGRPRSLHIAFERILYQETFRWAFGTRCGLEECLSELYMRHTGGTTHI